jgi:hypothetical protein
MSGCFSAARTPATAATRVPRPAKAAPPCFSKKPQRPECTPTPEL